MRRRQEARYHPPSKRGGPRYRPRPASIEAYLQTWRRRERVERVVGHPKQNQGLRTLKLRRIAGAAEKFTMVATALNPQVLAWKAAPA